jgi:signal transduction histidine kinase/CheY-like chemotaxis protein
MPPKALRQTWSGRAAYALITELLAGPPGESPEAIWKRYATSVRRAAAADAVVVLVPGPDGLLVQGSCHGRECRFEGLEAGGIGVLLGAARTIDVAGPRRGQPAAPLAAELAVRTGARYVTAVPLRPAIAGPAEASASEPGALVLLNQHRGLFEADDAVLLGELAVQAAVLAEQGRVAAHMAAAAEAATLASKAKSDFLANMSHELRTPLNAIIGFSELMGGEDTDGDSRWVPNEWIDHIRNGGRHLLGLINDVLDLSKVEAGRIELFPEALPLPDVIGEAVATLGPLIRAHELELTVAVPPLTITADPIRFRQIVDNLLSNAIKFTPEGGQIFIAAHRDGDQTHVSVTDTGPGIAQADQPLVFTEFTQVGDVGKRKSGTGLGLPLARRLAQAHGGDIDLESEPGHGTRFTITMPNGIISNVNAADTDGPVVCRAGGVLVIEDDPAAALLLSTHLERAGYPVTVAATGEEGLAAARTCQPAVILLDLILPGIDGRRVLAQLKDDPWLRQIPVAIISVTDEREVGLALGAVDYFVKPVNHGALLAWLAHHGFIPPLSDRSTNVLVIDDDPATIAVVRQTLSRQGIGVAEAANGLDGLRLARAHPFDLIICDLLMPGLDGYTVIAALHDDPATEHTPVLVLTAQDLTAADRSRLDGKTLAVVSKGGTAVTDIQRWVERISELTAARN